MNYIKKEGNYVTTMLPYRNYFAVLIIVSLHLNSTTMPDSVIRNFIDDHGLKRADGVTAFDAIITFYDHKAIGYSIPSEVQIITVSGEPVIYLIEPFQELYQLPEMYKATAHHFSYSNGGALEIRGTEFEQQFIVSIKPVNIKYRDEIVHT